MGERLGAPFFTVPRLLLFSCGKSNGLAVASARTLVAAIAALPNNVCKKNLRVVILSSWAVQITNKPSVQA